MQWVFYGPFLKVNSERGISAGWVEIALVYTITSLSQLATPNTAALPWQSLGLLWFPGLPRCHLVINDLTEYISLLLPGGPGVLFQSVSVEEKFRHMIREGTLGNVEKQPRILRQTTAFSFCLWPFHQTCPLIGQNQNYYDRSSSCISFKVKHIFWERRWKTHRQTV